MFVNAVLVAIVRKTWTRTVPGIYRASVFRNWLSPTGL